MENPSPRKDWIYPENYNKSQRSFDFQRENYLENQNEYYDNEAYRDIVTQANFYKQYS